MKRLPRKLRPLCDSVAHCLQRANKAATGVTLKLKTSDFQVPSRSRKLADPTRRAEILYRRPARRSGAGGSARPVRRAHRMSM
jgi:hypothetical protein